MTSDAQLDRTAKLKVVYADLKTDLLEEVAMMDARIIKPATDAKDFLQPLRKTIKKRENKRVDWERYIDKVNTLQSKKLKRTDRENAALAKAEEDLAGAADVRFIQNSLFLQAVDVAKRRQPVEHVRSNYCYRLSKSQTTI